MVMQKCERGIRSDNATNAILCVQENAGLEKCNIQCVDCQKNNV